MKTEQIIEDIVRYEVKKLAARIAVPNENIRVEAWRDLEIESLICHIEVSMRGTIVDGSQKDTIVGTIPASLKDWLKFYAKKFLGRFGKSIAFKSKDLIKRHHETWNVCPHGDATKSGCMRFMAFGSDFSKFNAEAREAAHRIVLAALRMGSSDDGPSGMWPSGELMHAIYHYRRVTGAMSE